MKPNDFLKTIDKDFTHLTIDEDGEVNVWSFKPEANKTAWYQDNNKTYKGLKISDTVPAWVVINWPDKPWNEQIYSRTTPKKKRAKK